MRGDSRKRFSAGVLLGLALLLVAALGPAAPPAAAAADEVFAGIQPFAKTPKKTGP